MRRESEIGGSDSFLPRVFTQSSFGAQFPYVHLISQQCHTTRPLLIRMSLLIFLKNYLFIFRERRREGEKHQCVVASHMPHNGDLACNPGMWPDWESNQWPFGSRAGAQSTEPHQPGLSPHLWCPTPYLAWTLTLLTPLQYLPSFLWLGHHSPVLTMLGFSPGSGATVDPPH